MPVRTDEEVREALEAQAHDNANAGELLDILRWSSSGNAAQKRARLLSFLDGPASRRMRAAISAGDAVGVSRRHKWLVGGIDRWRGCFGLARGLWIEWRRFS